jgi:hypothetical protein
MQVSEWEEIVPVAIKVDVDPRFFEHLNLRKGAFLRRYTFYLFPTYETWTQRVPYFDRSLSKKAFEKEARRSFNLIHDGKYRIKDVEWESDCVLLVECYKSY